MASPGQPSHQVRFGAFALDLQTAELSDNGHKFTLQEQPFRVLVVLLEHPGRLVTREELKRELWPADTFVDFDRGLNKAVNRLREALGDSAENPQFIETLPRKGYRFICPLATPVGPSPEHRIAEVSPSTERTAHKFRQRAAWIAGTFLILATAGPLMRITAQLIQARVDKQLWADTYQGDVRDVLGLQNQVASAIARQIRVKLSPEQQAALQNARAINPEAYEAYLRGFSQRRTVDGFHQKIAYFERALARQPDYAEAHVGLADAYMYLGHVVALPPQEAFPRAKSEALKALQLDDFQAEAHELLGTVKFLYDWDFPGAEKEFQRALVVNPNSVEAHSYYSDFLSAMGRPDEAIAEEIRIRQIDPLSVSAGVAMQQYWAGRYDPAIENARSVLGSDPNHYGGHLCLGLALAQKRQFPEAIVELQKAVDLSNEQMWMAFVAHAKALAGDRVGARKILADLEALSRRTYVSPWLLALVYPDLGDEEQAFFWLEKCYQGREHDLVFSRVWPMFDSLRSDPRYQDLMRRVGLPLDSAGVPHETARTNATR